QKEADRLAGGGHRQHKGKKDSNGFETKLVGPCRLRAKRC
ncbi:unnamed protein product, partial [marine sediment metagenome]